MEAFHVGILPWWLKWHTPLSASSVLKGCLSSSVFGSHSSEVFIICMSKGTGESILLRSFSQCGRALTRAEAKVLASVLSLPSEDRSGLQNQPHSVTEPGCTEGPRLLGSTALCK